MNTRLDRAAEGGTVRKANEELQQAAYQERLIRRRGLPLVENCPKYPLRSSELLTRVEQGEHVSEREVFLAYFAQMQREDSEYFYEVQKVAAAMEALSPETAAALPDRRLQIIVPAYRESQGIDDFLRIIEEQYDKGENRDWGVTIALDYKIPYVQPMEDAERRKVEQKIDALLVRRPELKSHLNYVFYYKRKSPETPTLTVGLPRKVVEDAMMYVRLLKTQEEKVPLYLGMMDMDTKELSPQMFSEMAALLPRTLTDHPQVVRVRGSFSREDVRRDPYIYPLEMMWEGATSNAGLYSKHNPFTVGRLSAVPARELALTGGGLAKKLEFPDEDIRRGLQIAWQVPTVTTVEPKGKYATSARREVHAVRSLMALIHDRDGVFDLKTMKVGALVDMYAEWSGSSFRGNVEKTDTLTREVFDDAERFERSVPRALVEAVVNAFYRFTLYSIYAVDVLSGPEGVTQIQELRRRFLAGEIPYFRVQLDTVDFINNTAQHDAETFERMKPLLADVDKRSREAMRRILAENNVGYTEDMDMGPIYGWTEQLELGQDPDRTPLQVRFKISEDQSGLAQHMKALLFPEE